MLNTQKSVSLTRDDLLVAYGANPGAALAIIAHLVVARAPRGPLPPASNDFWSKGKALRTALNATKLMQDAWFDLRQVADRPKRFEEVFKSQDAVIASQWLTIGNTLPAQVGLLLGPTLDNMGDPLPSAAPFGDLKQYLDLLMGYEQAEEGKTAARTRYAMGAWSSGPGAYSMDLDGEPLAGGAPDADIYNPDLSTAFTLIAMRLAYPRLRASTWLAGDVETPPGADKQLWPMLEKASRLSTCVKLLMDQPRLLELRSRVRFCMQPLLQPIRDALGEDKRVALETLGNAVLNEPMHPWFAEIERLLLPSARPTRWASASPTIGLIAQGAFHKLREEKAKSGATMAHRLIGGSLFRSTLKDLQNWALWQAELKDGARKEGALATLGFVGAKAPLPLHLYGSTFTPVASDGVYASESVADVLEYVVRTPTALRDADGSSRLSGPLSLYVYRAPGVDAAGAESPLHIGRHKYWEPGRVPPVFVEPLQPELDPRGGLGDISPDMVLPVTDSQYWGEVDAIHGPYTPEGVAAMLALPDGAASVITFAKDKAVSVKRGFEHLFRVGGAGNVERVHPSATQVFYSPRTNKPWLRRVDLSRDVVPVLTVALSSTTSPVELPVESVVAIDDQPVAASVPMSPIAEAYADRLLEWSR